MINFRSRAFIIFSVIVFLVLAGVILILALRGGDTTDQPEGEGGSPQTTAGEFDDALVSTPPTVVPAGTQVHQASTEEMKRNAALKIAQIFAERYGTYSTHGDYDNIKDVQILVTENLWAKLNSQVPATSNGNVGEYRGVTARAVAANITDWRDDAATVEVSILKTESTSTSVVNSNQNIIVEVVESGDSWLVEDFNWQ